MPEGKDVRVTPDPNNPDKVILRQTPGGDIETKVRGLWVLGGILKRLNEDAVRSGLMEPFVIMWPEKIGDETYSEAGAEGICLEQGKELLELSTVDCCLGCLNYLRILAEVNNGGLGVEDHKKDSLFMRGGGVLEMVDAGLIGAGKMGGDLWRKEIEGGDLARVLRGFFVGDNEREGVRLRLIPASVATVIDNLGQVNRAGEAMRVLAESMGIGQSSRELAVEISEAKMRQHRRELVEWRKSLINLDRYFIESERIIESSRISRLVSKAGRVQMENGKIGFCQRDFEFAKADIAREVMRMYPKLFGYV